MNLAFSRALAARDLRRYFANPTGYVFITLFIFLSAAAAFWRPRFFLNNLATLDQINEVFPLLLLFFIPALTMGVWAEERREGTDELLLTLPASDVAIVLGKYLAVLGVYSISLILSLSHVAVLFWLGRPDGGLMAANYTGFWLAGASLIALGMAGSQLASHATVAFLLAVLFCAAPVLAAPAAALFGDGVGRNVAALGLGTYFADFSRGIVSLSAVLYFVLLGVLGIFANVALLGRRHWTARGMGLHYVVRVSSLAAAFAAAVLLASFSGVRADVTAEQLHSLGDDTRRLMSELPPDRPVTIQAFVSPTVPEEYVQQREQLLGTLRELDAIAGVRLDVIIRDTEPFSDAARLARERFGIVPRLAPGDGGSGTQSVFLGVGLTSGAEEAVIPFLEHGLSAEYELTRAVRVAARAARKRVGIVDTDAKVFGGIDYESGRSRLRWAIVTELARQYEIVQITPWEPIQETVDALLVVLPSTLLQREMDHVFEAIKGGIPAMLIVDPVPATNMDLAPAASMAARMNPYAQARALVRKNTGDIQKAMAEIGVSWPPARIAWDSYRPDADSTQMPQEVVFIGPGSGNAEAFNPRHPATSRLQELMLMYAGALSPAPAADVTFEPLLSTGTLAGTSSYFQLVQPTEAGPVLNVKLPHEPAGQALTLAAEVRSSSAARPLRAVVVADLDFISDQFFAMRASGLRPATLDNVTFFLNSIDVLAGDDAFIGLRARRARYRTLERLEAQTRVFLERRSREEQQASSNAQAALDGAQKVLDARVAEIEQRGDLDAQARQIVVRNLLETENRKLEVLRANIEQTRDTTIQASREAMGREVRRIQSGIRMTAVVAPPLPVLLVGMLVLVRRRRREREGAVALRRVRSTS